MNDPTRPSYEDLTASLDRSQADLAAGRLVPAEPFLGEMRERALRRIEAREAAGQDRSHKAADAAE